MMPLSEALQLVETMRDAERGAAEGYRSRGLVSHAKVAETNAAALATLLEAMGRVLAAAQLPLPLKAS